MSYSLNAVDQKAKQYWFTTEGAQYACISYLHGKNVIHKDKYYCVWGGGGDCGRAKPEFWDILSFNILETNPPDFKQRSWKNRIIG